MFNFRQNTDKIIDLSQLDKKWGAKTQKEQQEAPNPPG